MLTIHTPIQLKNDPSILTIGDGFAARMSANYQQIGSDLTSEDLLHLISAPPEIYLAEGAAHSLTDITNSYQSQEIKLNLINNVLNRVLVSDTYDMTYQDEVFIENTLHKLGVTDVKEFMRQVQILQQETKNRNELTDIYWDNHEELLALTRRYEQARSIERRSEDGQREADEGSALWLHEKILDRLRTGVVYQEIRNYTSQRMGDTRLLSRQEMQVSEQSVMAEHILLNRLKNQVTVEAVPFVYNHINTYELAGENEPDAGGETTVRQLLQAVLLHAVDEIYAVRFNELRSSRNIWYELANAVYETAANTFERFENYHSRTQVSHSDIRRYHEKLQTQQSREITSLQRLLEIREMSRSTYEPAPVQEAAQLVHRTAEEAGDDGGESYIHQDVRVTNGTDISYQQQTQEITALQQLFESRETADTVHVPGAVQEAAQLVHRTAEEAGDDGERGPDIYQDARVTNENYIRHQKERLEIMNLQQGDALLNQQINMVSQQDTQRQERLERLEREIQTHRETHPAQEAAELLHPPAGDAKEDGRNGADIYQDARVTSENYIRNQQEERRVITNQREGDELLQQQINVINRHNMQRLERLESLEKEMQVHHDMHIDRAKAQGDVLRAIGNQEEVLLEYMSTQSPAEAAAGQQREMLREIYDEDTIRIFETIERYRREPEVLLEKGIISNDPLGQLQRDIHLQYLTTEQFSGEEHERQTTEVHREVERIRTEKERRLTDAPLRREIHRQAVEAVELHHRETATAIDEELLEELRTVNRQTLLSNTQVQELVNEHTVTEETVINRVNELQLSRNEELEELVSRNVRQQLRGMSEQVYQKLEKRMDMERRRRGI